MNNKIIYWDSCIFIAWLMKEDAYKGFLDAAIKIIEEAEKKERDNVSIITSVVTFTEVLQGKIDSVMFREFERAFQRKSLIAYDVDDGIAKLAGEIRTFYKKEDGSPKIPALDALHMATAIKHNASELHSFDGSGKKKGLIQYSGRVADKYDISIVPPQRSQLTFGFNALHGKIVRVDE